MSQPPVPSQGPAHAAKPALRKHPSNGAHGHGIAWNEENLAENEKIKAALPHVKITEPKTPFHELLPDDDVDLQPLALDGEAPPSNGHAPGAEDEEHKKKFEAARKAHYNMRDLLAHKTSFGDDDDDKPANGNGK